MPVSEDSPTQRQVRLPRVEYVALALVVVGLLIASGTGMIPLPLKDFVEYWSAGDVFLSGGNPYDPQALNGSLANALGDDRLPTMMWNPPWTLPLTVPFAVLPIRLAHVLWMAVQLTLVLLSAHWLWRVYGNGRADPGGWLRAAVLLFPPTFFLLVYGQIGAFCLFGVAGFLYFMDRDQPIPAGLCLALTAIKPHLLFAFGLYLLLETLTCRQTRVAVISGAIAVVAMALLAWQINAHVYADYFTALRAPTADDGMVNVQDWRLPLASYWLRMSIDSDQFWIQFVPMALVVLATFVYWRKAPGRRDWMSITPGLVVASLLAAPYGGWLFDLVLLLVPVIHLVSRLNGTAATFALAAITGLNVFVLVGMPAAGAMALERYLWFAPLVAAVYAVGLLWFNGMLFNRRKPVEPPLLRAHA